MRTQVDKALSDDQRLSHGDVVSVIRDYLSPARLSWGGGFFRWTVDGFDYRRDPRLERNEPPDPGLAALGGDFLAFLAGAPLADELLGLYRQAVVVEDWKPEAVDTVGRLAFAVGCGERETSKHRRAWWWADALAALGRVRRVVGPSVARQFFDCRDDTAGFLEKLIDEPSTVHDVLDALVLLGSELRHYEDQVARCLVDLVHDIDSALDLVVHGDVRHERDALMRVAADAHDELEEADLLALLTLRSTRLGSYAGRSQMALRSYPVIDDSLDDDDVIDRTGGIAVSVDEDATVLKATVRLSTSWPRPAGVPTVWVTWIHDADLVAVSALQPSAGTDDSGLASASLPVRPEFSDLDRGFVYLTTELGGRVTDVVVAAISRAEAARRAAARSSRRIGLLERCVRPLLEFANHQLPAADPRFERSDASSSVLSAYTSLVLAHVHGEIALASGTQDGLNDRDRLRETARKTLETSTADPDREFRYLHETVVADAPPPFIADLVSYARRR